MTSGRAPATRESASVAAARTAGRPLVALESTVYSNLGLPSPHNRDALRRCVEAIEGAGAVAAITAVIDGELCIGLEDEEVELVLGATTKTAERDLAVAVAERRPVGVTTVSASLAIAHRSGVQVFATGGIGGVHRGAEATGDVSADLDAMARHPVVTVSAGAKSFLDLPRTLELLESLSVPVVGWQTDEFPAFTARTSGIALRHRIDDLEVLARAASAQIGLGRGLLIVNPVPISDALDQRVHDDALDAALRAADRAGVSGPAVTPFVLNEIAEATGGASIPANLALVENNARLAARLAVRMAAD